MKWTIINSIDLAKIYPISKTKIFVSDNFTKRSDLIKFFDSFRIPYYFGKNIISSDDQIYFGSSVDFQNLYILAGILKSYGFKELLYKPSLTEKITLGSIKRKTINSRKIAVPIDIILELPFDTTFQDFCISLNLNQNEKIDLNEYYVKNGWEIPNAISEEEKFDNEDYEDEDENIDIDELLKKYDDRGDDIDPYENFQWGGLSGEEAYIGYWNTD